MSRLRVCLPVLFLALSPLLALAQDEDPAEVAIGERLFLETRFAEFFARNSNGEVNAPLPAGDPVVDTTETTGDPLDGPFAGQAINCRACHLVDEQLAVDPLGIPDFSAGGMRTYADFARRSPVPEREDGLTHTPRNSPPLVNASVVHKSGTQLHFDGEFASLRMLVRETLVGRNYGWLPSERKQAMAHIARVIRKDDGSGELAHEFGGSYRRVLLGEDAGVPEELHLPANFRLDVVKADDGAIVDLVARLITAYVGQLEFTRDHAGAFESSPYDLFLLRNSLPREPKKRESVASYNRRLAAAIDALPAPLFVVDVDGPYAFHDQLFEFGETELEGLRVFLGRGNCAACHPAPFFTDFLFHDTGVSQFEYDDVHGAGAFASLEIPTLRERNADPNAFLPATAKHPEATGRFRAAVDGGRPELADLGAWNVLFNRDFPQAQAKLKKAIARSLGTRANKAELLDASIARFKTPGLRDLGHSNPYMHNGAFDSLESVAEHYQRASDAMRGGQLRNGAPELADIDLSGDDVEAIAAFLRSLNEDYE